MPKFLVYALPMSLGLLFASTDAIAQTREITGRVTVAGTGRPLSEAIVAILGQAGGSRTDQNGEFRLRVPQGDVTLLARAIGYKRSMQRVGAGLANANFSLDRDVLEL